jgi:sphingomyelin phosphodiesterase acid-like 3
VFKFGALNLMLSRLTCVLALLVSVFDPTVGCAEDGQFLLISDIHFNPYYDGTLFGQLRDQPVERWPEILQGSKPAGINPRGTDSNYALLKSSLDEARARIPDPDFILYPGDLMAHGWQAKYDGLAMKTHLEDPEAYRSFTAKVIRFLALEFRRRYPDVAILPTLGNDDSYCGDYMIEPDGAFLAMFASTWEPLLGAGPGREGFRQTFDRGGYYSIPLPRSKAHRLVVLNSVFFSVNYDDACGPSGATPALDQFRWLEETIERAHAAKEVVWLLMHIPPGINSFNSAEDVLHGGKASTFWQPELTGRFLQLLRRYPGTIRAAFAGHTHMDDFRAISTGDGESLFCKIAPAISPIFGNNPGFQIFQYDRSGGALRNFQTHSIADDRPAPPAGAVWSREYDFQEAYGLGPPTAETVVRLASEMARDGMTRQLYTRFYAVSAPPEFTPRTFDVYRCAIPNVTPAEFLTCLKGQPKPGRPEPFPDRKASAVGRGRQGEIPHINERNYCRSEEPAIAHPDLSVGGAGDLGGVGDQDQGEASGLLEAVEEGQDLALVLAVEVAGGLVGEDQGRLVGQGPGDGHPLPFSHGKAARPMGLAMGQAHLGEEAGGPLGSLGAGPGGLEHRDLDVLQRGQGGDQVEGLEDEADAQGPEPIQVHRRERCPAKADLAAVGAVQAAQDVQECALAAAAGAGDGHEFALGDLQVDASEGMDVAVGVGLLQAESPQQRGRPVGLTHGAGPPWARVWRRGGRDRGLRPG